MAITQSIHSPLRPWLRTLVQLLQFSHESVKFRDRHLPDAGALYHRRPLILFPRLSGHRIAGPQAHPDGLLAALRALHSGLCSGTLGWAHAPFLLLSWSFPRSRPQPGSSQLPRRVGKTRGSSQSFLRPCSPPSFPSRTIIPLHQDGHVRKRLPD